MSESSYLTISSGRVIISNRIFLLHLLSTDVTKLVPVVQLKSHYMYVYVYMHACVCIQEREREIKTSFTPRRQLNMILSHHNVVITHDNYMYM